MLKKLRIGQIMDTLWLFLVVAALSIFMLSHAGLSSITALMGPRPLKSDADLDEMTGKYVTWEVKYPVDEYMETTKTTKVNGVSTGTKKDRSSWLVLDEDRGICLSIEVPHKRYDEMLAQSDDFLDALYSGNELPATGVTVSGSLEILEGEDLGYFEYALDYYEFPSEPVVYHISDGRIHGETLMNIYGITAIGAFLLLIALLIMFKTLKNSAKKLIQEYLAANPSITMEALESDFASATKRGKHVYVGSRWTFSAKLDKLILDNSQIIWVHTGSRRSGRSVNFYVWWEMLDGRTEQVSLSSAYKCTEVMESYSQFPHILIGSSSEYAYLLQNNREELLNLKFRGQEQL